MNLLTSFLFPSLKSAQATWSPTRDVEKPAIWLETVIKDIYGWIQFHRHQSWMTFSSYWLFHSCWSYFSDAENKLLNKFFDFAEIQTGPPDPQADVLTARPRRPP